MVEPEEIRTRRLLLRRPEPADAEPFIALHNTPEAYPHDSWLRRSPEDARQQLDSFGEKWDENGIGYWTIRLAETGEVIGFGGLQHWDGDGDPVLNLYYRFFPTAWGNGYAPEMAAAAIDWARRHRPEHPVRIVTGSENRASIRIAEKLGFKFEEHRERDGRPEVVYLLDHSR
ncbi:GNAT family N-acetyltransferase [Saccharopolyspora oryzae]|uniref:GNAT family N-acetyltransferase n=1 Tax=Saccharopolyspora oryzae TaxID=2997343 RepID=A0ABT4V3R0_9PSEU|nr:GNAT family N-acetyltransferase [Saccharopolyspora oryzae]MDA3628600.1 GNAT family N-acetyltransferase [Saccharopolyspora oryzae]